MARVDAPPKFDFDAEVVEIRFNNLELIGFGARLDRYVQSTINARKRGERLNKSPRYTTPPQVQLTVDSQATLWSVRSPTQECCHCRSILFERCDEDATPDGRAIARYLFARSYGSDNLELIPFMAVITYNPRKSDVHQRSRFAHGELLRLSVSF